MNVPKKRYQQRSSRNGSVGSSDVDLRIASLPYSHNERIITLFG